MKESTGFGDSFNAKGRSGAGATDPNDPQFLRERGLFSSEVDDEAKRALVEQARAESLSPDRGNATKSSEASGTGNPQKPLSLFGNKK